MVSRKPASRPCRAKSSAAATASLLALFAARHAGAEATWTGVSGGTGGTALWTSNTNWANNALPAAGDSVRFGTGFNSGLTVNAFGRRIISSLIVDTTQSFTLANFGGVGDAIILTNGNLDRTASSSGTQTVSSDISLGDQDFWSIMGSGRLVVTGSITGDGTNGFDRAGNGILALSGPASDMAHVYLYGGGTRFNGGTMTLNHAVNADVLRVGEMAAMHVENGAVVTAPDQGAGGNAVISTTNGNGIVYVNGAGSRLSLPADVRLGDGSFSGAAAAGTIFVEAGGALSVAGAVQIGNRNGDSGLLRAVSGGTFTAGSVEIGLRPGASGDLVVSGDGSAGTIGFLTLGGSSPTVNGGVGRATVVNGGSLTVNSELYFYTSDSVVVASRGQMYVASLRHASGITPTIRLADTTAGAAALTVGIDNSSSTFAGKITNDNGLAGSLVKVGNGTLTLSGTLDYTGRTEVGVGRLVLPNGLPTAGGTLSVNGGAALYAAGTINRAATIGGTIVATGTLVIGNPNATSGFLLSTGTLNVGSQHVLLQCSGDSVVDGLVQLGDGARLDSTNGILNGDVVKVAANASAVIAGTFENFGTVNGPTAAGKMLTFTGSVEAFGAYDGNIALAGGFDGGYSGPGTYGFGTLKIGDDATINCDVLKFGSDKFEDRIAATGSLSIDGDLKLRYNNENLESPPAQGDVWTVFTASSITGQFDNITGRRINATTWLATIYSPTTVRIAVALPGDATLDGTVGIGDFSLVATHFNQSGFDWTGGDFNGTGTVEIGDFAALAARFNQSIAAPLPRTAVPEPTIATFATLAILATLHRRRRDTKTASPENA